VKRRKAMQQQREWEGDSQGGQGRQKQEVAQMKEVK
jgi:hypothetical protein